MFKKIGIGVVVLVLAFLGYVSTREGKFHYERSGEIAAPAEKIFPYLSNFELGDKWSPFTQLDPNMKKVFIGPVDQVGSVYEFDGNRDVGTGKLEFLKIVPNESVELKLTMIKPFFAENLVKYNLTPAGNGTLFTWSMEGDGGFMGKLINVFIDCEKMIGAQFEKGIASLKAIAEGAQ